MADSTPGVSKSVAATVAAVFGGELSKIIIRIVAHQWPWLADPDTSDAIDDVITGAVVWAAAYFTPHSITGKTTPPS